MQKYSVIVTETAALELESYLDFIARDSLENAVNWYYRVYEKIQTLETMPERCHAAAENPYFEFEVYCLLVEDYRVIYRIDGDRVEVLHVKHPRMKR